jgi:hypothetical protein
MSCRRSSSAIEEEIEKISLEMKKCVAYIQKRSYMRERLFQRKLLK